MKPFNAILAYYQQICDGSVTVGRWIRLAYTWIIEELEAKRLIFDQKKSDEDPKHRVLFCWSYGRKRLSVASSD